MSFSFLRLHDCANKAVLTQNAVRKPFLELSSARCSCRSIRSIILRSCENLSQFPSKLYRLTTLTELDVEGSDNIITPPPEVMSKGLPAVREFLNWLYDGENSDSANFVNQGLHHAPAALAEVCQPSSR